MTYFPSLRWISVSIKDHKSLAATVLINCDSKPVTQTPENILLHAKLENRALSIRHLCTKVQYQHDERKSAKFKITGSIYVNNKCIIVPSYIILG
jgi:hypothetical protein